MFYNTYLINLCNLLYFEMFDYGNQLKLEVGPTQVLNILWAI